MGSRARRHNRRASAAAQHKSPDAIFRCKKNNQRGILMQLWLHDRIHREWLEQYLKSGHEIVSFVERRLRNKVLNSGFEIISTILILISRTLLGTYHSRAGSCRFRLKYILPVGINFAVDALRSRIIKWTLIVVIWEKNRACNKCEHKVSQIGFGQQMKRISMTATLKVVNFCIFFCWRCWGWHTILRHILCRKQLTFLICTLSDDGLPGFVRLCAARTGENWIDNATQRIFQSCSERRG